MQCANIKLKIKLQLDTIYVMYVGMVNDGVCACAEPRKATRGKMEVTKFEQCESIQ